MKNCKEQTLDIRCLLNAFRKCLQYVIGILCFFMLFDSGFVYASKRDTLHAGGAWAYVENLGQWDNQILFKARMHDGALFFEKNGYSVVVQDRKAIDKLVESKLDYKVRLGPPADNTVGCHAYKVHFENASENTQIETFYPSSDYRNYYVGDDPSRWKSFVRAYSKVKYNNLYEGIDYIIYSHENQFKYDLVVKPSAKVSDIQMRYEGLDKISLSRGSLQLRTSINTIVELQPYAYQLIDELEKEVVCNFVLNKNIVGFECPNYDPNFPLIIDPVMIFSTYTGSTSDNWGYTATYDQYGFLYSGGCSFGVGYPVTTGAYQVNYGGGGPNNVDIAITKFDTTGSFLIYSTYLGGTGTEVPHSLIVNDNNELYVLATTGSANYPTTAGCYDNTFNGGTSYVLTYVLHYTNGADIAISKFSANGSQLLASTYFGGSGNDGLNTIPVLKKNYADDVRGEIMIDENSNVYVVSSTTSTDFPVTSGAFQQNHAGGTQDGVVFKFNHNLTNLIWSSYLGGNGDDACYSIQIDTENNVYIGGGTNSSNFPTTSGVVQPNHGGGVDGYVTLINKNGNAILASTYYGSSLYDQVYLTKTDRDNNVFIFGQTQAPGNFFIFNALWNKPGGGQFLSKLSPNLQTVFWSTAFGSATNTSGQPDISPTSLMVDLCNNIYMAGWGGLQLNGFGGTNGMPITSDAFQSTTDNHDYYFLVIADDASDIVYGSFFGDPIAKEHVDGGTSRFDKKGRIYQAICAGCGGNSNMPTSPNAWSPTNQSYNCNLGAVKFDFQLPAIIADFVAPNIICAPATINFQNTSQTIPTGTTIWNWNFGDGTISTLKDPSHTYTESGIYDIRLIIRNIGSCNFADTIIKQIIVLSNTKDTLPEQHICYGDFVQIGVPPAGSSAITYIWTPPSGLSNTNTSNPIANPNNTTNYMLRVSDGVCIDTLIQKVNVYDITLNAGNNLTVCRGDTANLTAAFSGGANRFYWSSNSNFSDTLNSNHLSTVFRPVINQTQTYYIHATNGYCSAYDSVKVNMSFADISAQTPLTICQGDTVQLSASNLISGQTITYTWLPASGIISGGNTANPRVSPPSTTTYIVTGRNSFGCKDTASVVVKVNSVQSTNQITHVRCYGQCNGSVQVIPFGGTAPYFYHWGHTGSNNNSASNLCAMDYSLTITDNIGCKKIQTFTIQQPSPIVISYTDTLQVMCNGDCSGQIRAVASGGVSPYQYAWINGQNSDLNVNLCAGLYTVTVTDYNLCTQTGQFRILDTSTFDAEGFAVAARCFGECNGIASVVASSGEPPYSYQWNIGIDSTAFHNLCAGTYNVTVSDFNNCLRNVFITVEQPLELIIDSIYRRNPLCNNSCNGVIKIFPIGGTPPYQYSWNEVSGQYTAENLCAGLYEISIFDANGCVLDTVIYLTEPDPLLIDIETTKVPCLEACIGSAVAIVSGGTPNYYYHWSNDQNQVTSIHDLCKGNYMLTVSDYNNCHTIAQFSIIDSSYFPPDGIEAWSDKDTIWETQDVQLYSTELDDFTYLWSPSASLNNSTISNPIATPSQTTDYIVYVSDQYGCMLSDTVRITVLEVICDEPFVYVPNAFTPNGDGNNDVLFVRSDIVVDVIFAVYDRWGEKIFETTQLNKGWDGTYKGKKCDPGVFVYYLDATCLNRDKLVKKGNVTLIR